ncbi:MAG: hypothetical protein HC914_12915 [Chloroflexaceae bacterium]|nr:hypothetical protein [Chloroflexaceae bacterium]
MSRSTPSTVRSGWRLLLLVWLLPVLLAACNLVSESAAPTPTATALPPRVAAEPTTNPANITNPEGFALTLPPGWVVAANEGAATFGGVVTLTPATVDTSAPTQAVVIGVSEQPLLVTDPITAGATLDDVLDEALQTLELDQQTGERSTTRISGLTARVVEIDTPQSQRRLAVARVDDTRWLVVYAYAPVAQWDAAAVDAVLRSLRVFEPSLALPPPYPLPPDASNLARVGNQTSFVTSLPIDAVMEFYRTALGAAGATERTAVTYATAEEFEMVFEGWPPANGQAVLIQGGLISIENEVGAIGQTVVTLQLE